MHGLFKLLGIPLTAALAACTSAGAPASPGGVSNGVVLKAEKNTLTSGEIIRLEANTPVRFFFKGNEQTQGAMGSIVQVNNTSATYPAPGYAASIKVTIRAQALSDPNRFADVELLINPPAGVKGTLSFTMGIAGFEVDLFTGNFKQIDLGFDITVKDGLYLLTDTGLSGPSADPGPSLYRIDTAKDRQEYLHYPATSQALDPRQPRISPTKRLISFHQLGFNPLSGQFGQHVYIYPNTDSVTLASALRAFKGFILAAWLPSSPDAPEGRLLMMNNPPDDLPNGIYLTDAQLNNPQLLAWDNAQFGIPTYAEPSPDGRQLAVETTLGHLYVADLKGNLLSNVRRVRTAEGLVFPGYVAWSPDSRWLAYFLGANTTQEVLISRADSESLLLKVLLNRSTGLLPLVATARYQLTWN